MKHFLKYSTELIDLILGELSNGASVKDLSKKYAIDTRRIYEWKNKHRKKVDVSIKQDLEIKEENEKVITSNSKEFLTIEEVLRKNGISQDEWEVTNVKINNWEDSSGEVHYQNKINLIKKNINLTYEVPAPIIFNNNSHQSYRATLNTNLKCAIILPDMQTGFRRDVNTGKLTAIHDRVAIDLALQLIKYLNPHRVVLLGDNLDLAEFSTKYQISNDFYFTTQASLVELAWWLGQIRSINPNMQIDYTQGNHEKRLEKYINEKAIALSGLKAANNLNGFPSISVESLLGLNSLNIKCHSYPEGKVALNSNLICIHGETAKGQSGATVSELVKSARVSVIQGHIHRHEVAVRTTWDAYDDYYQYTAASFGCLCKIAPGVVPGMKIRQNWQNGIGIVWYEESGLEQFRLEYVPIINGRSLYDGVIFNGSNESDIVKNIESDTNYKVS